jgi:hypothetical protein
MEVQAAKTNVPRSPLVSSLWSVLAVITGVVAGSIVVFVVELPGIFLHPPPADFDMRDAEAVRAHFARAPLPALIGIAVAWTAGPLVGCWLAAWIARRAYFAHGFAVACFFLAAVVMNLRTFPHPTWLALIGVVAPIAMSWIGSSLAERMARRRAGPKPYDMREKNMAC